MQVTGTATGSTTESQLLDQGKQQVMGKDDFLRLLTTQLKHQDPVNPINNENFVAQLAQFSTLEQMQNLGENIKEFVAAQTRMSSLGQASSLLGKEVDVTTDSGIVTGTVSGLRVSATGTAFLSIDGDLYSLSDVIAVKA